MSRQKEKGKRQKGSELREPVWAVMDWEKVIACDLTYRQACMMMPGARWEGPSHYLIVTNEVARRVLNKEAAPSYELDSGRRVGQ